MGHCGESTKHDGLRYFFEEVSRLDYDRAKEVLNFERAARDVYRDAWKKAGSLYKVRRKQDPSHKQWGVMKKENFVAIMCYTLEKPNVCRHFNQLCRAAAPTQESWNSFPFKSLLYFLIDAFIRLPDHHAPVVFRGVDKFVYSHNEARFSQFLSASVSARQAAKFGHGVFRLVLQGIPASLVKDISPYAVYPLHKEVLIWPFCVFTLTAGQEEGVHILKFDHRKTWTSESRSHVAGGATSNCSATAKIKSSKRPLTPGDQGAKFPLGAPSAKLTSLQTTLEYGHLVPPAPSPFRLCVRQVRTGTAPAGGKGGRPAPQNSRLPPLCTRNNKRSQNTTHKFPASLPPRRDSLVVGAPPVKKSSRRRRRRTSAGATTSSTVATQRSLRNLIDEIKRDLTGQCSSSDQSSLKVVPGPSTERMNERSSAGQVCVHMQPNTWAPPHQVMRDTVVTIPCESSGEHSVRYPAGRPTWNPYVTPVAARHNLNQTGAHVEWERMGTGHEEHKSFSSFDDHRGNRVPWMQIAGAFLIGLIAFIRSR